MTTKEKCYNLFDKFYKKVGLREQAKQCALIAVDEIINVAQYSAHLGKGHPLSETLEYWQQVKSEIEKL